MCIRSDIVRSVQRNHIRQKIEKYHKNKILSFIEDLEGVSISKLAVLKAWSVVKTCRRVKFEAQSYWCETRTLDFVVIYYFRKSLEIQTSLIFSTVLLTVSREQGIL